LSNPAPAKVHGDEHGVPVALITLTVMIGLIMAIIDSSIVNVAVNDIAGTLGASLDEVGWVVTGYILASVIVMPLNGWLTARFGRRNFYAGCLIVFTVSSLLCGTATSVWQLVFYRVIQGLGGGALQPTAQAILFESYPPERRSNAMAIFGLGAMVGPAIGPTLGGWIVDNFSWPLIFFINIPLGIIAVAMTFAFIRDQSYIKRDTSPVDWFGLGLLSAGVASLQFVLERGQHDDWFDSQTIVVSAWIAGISLVWFIIRQLRATNPLVDLSVFRSRSFTGANVIGVISGFGLWGLNLISPLFFENVLGLDAMQSGLALLPGAVATALSMPVAGWLGNRLDARIAIGFGIAFFGVGSWMMGSLNADAGYWDIFWPRAIQGFALGTLFVPLTTAALAEVPRAQMSNATGVYTLIRQLGGSLGIAALQVYEQRRESTAYTALTGGVTHANANVNALIGQAPSHLGALMQLSDMVRANAQTIAYDDVFRLCAILFFLALPTVLLLRSRRAAAAAAVFE
jgi:DHA2 family multidrug resistance protein